MSPNPLREIGRSLSSFGILYILGLSLMLLYKWLTGLNDYVIPSGTQIRQTLTSLWIVTLLRTSQTYLYAVVGYVVALVLAVAMSLLIATLPRLGAIARPAISAFQSYPIVAIIPLLLICFGEGVRTRILIIVAICYFPMLLLLLSALAIPDDRVENFYRNLYPSSRARRMAVRVLERLPALLDGLAGTFPLAVVGAVVAEMLAINAGIGYLIRIAHSSNQLPAILVALFALGLVTSIVVGLLRFMTLVVHRRYGFEENAEG
jgi:NitT/TauT family transport system permease protein